MPIATEIRLYRFRIVTSVTPATSATSFWVHGLLHRMAEMEIVASTAPHGRAPPPTARPGHHAPAAAPQHEVAACRPPRQDRGILSHVPRQTHLRGHRVDLREALREGTFPALGRPDAVLPLPEAVNLGPRLVRNLPAVGVLVPPADRRREALVMGHDRARRSRPPPG